MRPTRLSEIAAAVDGRLDGDDVVVTEVGIDSRRAAPGSLFIALEGARADGHAFVNDALANGAAAALVRSDAPRVAAPSVRAERTGEALLQLAAAEREHVDAAVVGVTGANGKTSTKDLAAAVLATRLRTYASPASFNNEIGVPLTILGAPPDAEAIVVEMGARRAGDVALLSRIARPGIVVVTNVGLAHLEIFGSWDAIVAAAREPIDALAGDGVAVLNADDPVVRSFGERRRSTVLFGTSRDADVRAEGVGLDRLGRAAFRLVSGTQREPVELSVPGEHMVSNAVAATAVGAAMGVTLAESAAALKDAAVSAWRMETFRGAGGLIIVNDAYNANPESMAAGLRAARWIAMNSRLIAVLGHMAELGPAGAREHERVGELAARLRIDHLIAVGEGAEPIARAAIREGLPSEDVEVVSDPQEAADAVRARARSGDVVFLKGSRVVGLERVAEALR